MYSSCSLLVAGGCGCSQVGQTQQVHMCRAGIRCDVPTGSQFDENFRSCPVSADTPPMMPNLQDAVIISLFRRKSVHQLIAAAFLSVLLAAAQFSPSWKQVHTAGRVQVACLVASLLSGHQTPNTLARRSVNTL